MSDLDGIVLNAGKDGNLSMIRRCIAFGLVDNESLDLEIVNADGENVLQMSILNNEYMLMLYLHQEVQLSLSNEDNGGYFPLLKAAYYNKFSIVKYLIEIGRVNVHQCNEESETAILLACRFGYIDLFEYLLFECGANIYMISEDLEQVLDEYVCEQYVGDDLDYRVAKIRTLIERKYGLPELYSEEDEDDDDDDDEEDSSMSSNTEESDLDEEEEEDQLEEENRVEHESNKRMRIS